MRCDISAPVDRSNRRTLRASSLTLVRVVAVVFCVLVAFGVAADDDPNVRQDLKQWTLFRLSDPIGEKWTFSFQYEIRFGEDISALDQWIVKPYASYKLGENFDLNFGYKYIYRPDSFNEQDPWFEPVFLRHYGKMAVSHQVRFEARLLENVDGVLPRVRYHFHFAHPWGDSGRYFGGSGAVRFNLGDKGDGTPVEGFEQSRLYAGVGWHVGRMSKTRLEVGYLWRYERQRTEPNWSDHVIRLQILFNTKGKKVRTPLPHESYR